MIRRYGGSGHSLIFTIIAILTCYGIFAIAYGTMNYIQFENEHRPYSCNVTQCDWTESICIAYNYYTFSDYSETNYTCKLVNLTLQLDNMSLNFNVTWSSNLTCPSSYPCYMEDNRLIRSDYETNFWVWLFVSGVL